MKAELNVNVTMTREEVYKAIVNYLVQQRAIPEIEGMTPRGIMLNWPDSRETEPRIYITYDPNE